MIWGAIISPDIHNDAWTKVEMCSPIMGNIQHPVLASLFALRVQLAAFRFTPLRKAIEDNFLSAAFSSFKFVFSSRIMSS